MKTVCRIDQCAGCMACVDTCPKAAVEIAQGLGAWNAVINEEKCVDCGLCHRVCPQNEAPAFHEPQKWYQGWAEDEEIHRRGSSGGVATALALAFVKNGGAVCSCVFDNGEFRFRIAEAEAEVLRFAGSKYVKSNPQGCYTEIKALLKAGKKVLFIGLPCQSAAAQKYVGSQYAKELYTVDLICHGTPSVQLLDKFLQEKKYELSSLEELKFRDKCLFQISVKGKPVLTPGLRDAYTLAFTQGLTYTENCYHCPYARKERVSDITLGDSWGSELDEATQKKGLSLILCQTQKGIDLAESSGLKLLPVDLDASVAGNDQLQHPSQKPGCREAFLRGITAGKSFHSLIAKCYPKQYYKIWLKHILARLRKP